MWFLPNIFVVHPVYIYMHVYKFTTILLYYGKKNIIIRTYIDFTLVKFTFRAKWLQVGTYTWYLPIPGIMAYIHTCCVIIVFENSNFEFGPKWRLFFVRTGFIESGKKFKTLPFIFYLFLSVLIWFFYVHNIITRLNSIRVDNNLWPFFFS